MWASTGSSTGWKKNVPPGRSGGVDDDPAETVVLGPVDFLDGPARSTSLNDTAICPRSAARCLGAEVERAAVVQHYGRRNRVRGRSLARSPRAGWTWNGWPLRNSTSATTPWVSESREPSLGVPLSFDPELGVDVPGIRDALILRLLHGHVVRLEVALVDVVHDGEARDALTWPSTGDRGAGHACLHAPSARSFGHRSAEDVRLSGRSSHHSQRRRDASSSPGSRRN